MNLTCNRATISRGYSWRDFAAMMVALSIGLVPAGRLAAAGEAEVAPPPEALRQQLTLDPFYEKCIDLDGFAVIGSRRVSDHAIREAAWIVGKMLAGREDIRRALAGNRVRLAVMACDERTIDIPEHSDLTPPQYWNKRARGLGPTSERPAVSCGEENLLEFDGDPYTGENILIHEFAHAIHLMGLNSIAPNFETQLAEAYKASLAAGLWQETYAATNKEEYWAEGVQIWFHCNRTNCREHNHLNTREELKEYDPGLARLAAEVFRDNDWVYVPPSQRTDAGHLAGFDRMQAPKFAWSPELLEWYKQYEAEQKARQPAAGN